MSRAWFVLLALVGAFLLGLWLPGPDDDLARHPCPAGTRLVVHADGTGDCYWK